MLKIEQKNFFPYTKMKFNEKSYKRTGVRIAKYVRSLSAIVILMKLTVYYIILSSLIYEFRFNFWLLNNILTIIQLSWNQQLILNLIRKTTIIFNYLI